MKKSDASLIADSDSAFGIGDGVEKGDTDGLRRRKETKTSW